MASKAACSVATTCAPSPTAAATRLTEPERRRRWRRHRAGSSPAAVGCSLPSAPVSTKPLASRHARSGQPIRIRLGADEQEQMADRAAHLLARPASAPADRLQHAVAALRGRVTVGLRHDLHIGQARRCDRPGSATCSPRGLARAPAARPWRHGSPGRPPPGPPNCRRPPGRPPARRTASPRAAMPSSARSRPRKRPGSRRRAAGSGLRWRSRPSGR